jgi:hypothetical protein
MSFRNVVLPWEGKKIIDTHQTRSIILLLSGHSSVGRVQASQAWCRGFESRCPLHVDPAQAKLAFYFLKPVLYNLINWDL